MSAGGRTPVGVLSRRVKGLNGILAVMAAGLVLVQGWSVSVPGGYLGTGLLAILGWGVVAVVWLVMAVKVLIARRRVQRQHQPGQVLRQAPGTRYLWPLVLVPLLVLLSLTLGQLQVAQHIRFRVDRAELDAAAAQVRTGEINLRRPPERIGTLPIRSIEKLDDCVLFTIESAGFISRNGYAHCPAEPPTGKYDETFQPMTENWYTWDLVGS